MEWTLISRISYVNPPPTPPVPPQITQDAGVWEKLRQLIFEAPTKPEYMQNIEEQMRIYQQNNPTWSDQVTDKITNSLSDKMDSIINSQTDKIVMWYQSKLDALLSWLKYESLDLIQVAFVCYMFYISFRMIFKGDENEKNWTNIYVAVMAYTIVRMVWHISFKV
jgi:hypothetical protein